MDQDVIATNSKAVAAHFHNEAENDGEAALRCRTRNRWMRLSREKSTAGFKPSARTIKGEGSDGKKI